MPTITVDVDVSLDDFDTEDLVDELESRGESAGDPEDDEGLREVYYALKFGLDDRAMQLMRRYVCDTLGVIL